MFSFLKSVVAIRRKDSNRPSAGGNRRAPLSLQRLEERQLLTASPLLAVAAPLYSDVALVQPPVTQNSLSSATSTAVVSDTHAAIDPSVLHREAQSIALKSVSDYTRITPLREFASEIGRFIDTSYLTLPRLNSNPGAAKTIFLDFLGGSPDQDFQYQAPRSSTTGGTADAILNSGGSRNLRDWNAPSFDLDGNHLSFSAAEQAVIKEIWQRVAEDFAPFDVNVTTDWGGSLTDRNMLRIIVGGHSVKAEGMADPYGLSQFDSMKQGGPNVAFVFADSIEALGGHFATIAANVASREAGHAFGLEYQTRSEIIPGDKIMGTHIGSELTRWAQGSVPVGFWQDDLKILASALGIRDDNQAGVTPLGDLDAAGTLHGQGIIGIPFVLHEVNNPGPEPVDVDTFSFQTSGGKIRFAAQGVGAGQNLEVRLEVWSSLTQVGKSPMWWESGSLDAALTLNLPAGTYYVKVRGGTGFQYGNLGQYTLGITDAHSVLALDSPVKSWLSVGSTEPITANPWLGGTTLQTGPVDYASLVGGEVRTVRGNLLSYIPPDLVSLSSSTSDGVLSDADLAAVFGTPFDPAIGLAGYATDANIPPVQNGGDLAFLAGGAFGIDDPQGLSTEPSQPPSLEAPKTV